jgi:hypothetical protein
MGGWPSWTSMLKVVPAPCLMSLLSLSAVFCLPRMKGLPVWLMAIEATPNTSASISARPTTAEVILPIHIALLAALLSMRPLPIRMERGSREGDPAPCNVTKVAYRTPRSERIPQMSYLWRTSEKTSHLHRPSILAELGRILGKDWPEGLEEARDGLRSYLDAVTWLGEHKPSTKRAVAVLRRRRASTVRPASETDLAEKIAKVIIDYCKVHPSIDDKIILRALNEVPSTLVKR